MTKNVLILARFLSRFHTRRVHEELDKLKSIKDTGPLISQSIWEYKTPMSLQINL